MRTPAPRRFARDVKHGGDEIYAGCKCVRRFDEPRIEQDAHGASLAFDRGRNPRRYKIEMLADVRNAGRAQTLQRVCRRILGDVRFGVPRRYRVRTATQLPESLDGALRQFDRQPLAWQVAGERRGLAGPEWSEIVDIPLLGL